MPVQGDASMIGCGILQAAARLLHRVYRSPLQDPCDRIALQRPTTAIVLRELFAAHKLHICAP